MYNIRIIKPFHQGKLLSAHSNIIRNIIYLYLYLLAEMTTLFIIYFATFGWVTMFSFNIPFNTLGYELYWYYLPIDYFNSSTWLSPSYVTQQTDFTGIDVVYMTTLKYLVIIQIFPFHTLILIHRPHYILIDMICEYLNFPWICNIFQCNFIFSDEFWNEWIVIIDYPQWDPFMNWRWN